MTYTGAMVLPQNAVCLSNEELRYVEGGKTWSRTFTTQNKKHKYQYKVTITNLTNAKYAALSAAAAIATIAGALLAGIGTAGTALAGSVCSALAGYAALALSCAQLKKMVTVTQVKKYY